MGDFDTLRAEHTGPGYERDDVSTGGRCCFACDEPVPCRTLRLLDAHDDLTAALAALAGRTRNEPCPTLCESCDYRGRVSCEFGEGRPIVHPRELRALLADPAAVLADRDRRIKAEAWDEGYEGAVDDYGCDVPFPGKDYRDNPYREGGRAGD